MTWFGTAQIGLLPGRERVPQRRRRCLAAGPVSDHRTRLAVGGLGAQGLPLDGRPTTGAAAAAAAAVPLVQGWPHFSDRGPFTIEIWTKARATPHRSVCFIIL